MLSKNYVIGFFGNIAIGTAILIFGYGLTFRDPDLTNQLLIALALLTTGLLMSFITVGFKWEGFSFKAMMPILLWTSLDMLAIFTVNRLIPFQMEISGLTPKLFAVLMGVAEECFFRLWLCPWMHKLTGESWLAILVSSSAWSVYHIKRYGANFNLLAIVFLCGCVLGASIIYSKRLDPSVFAHGGVNFIAVP